MQGLAFNFFGKRSKSAEVPASSAVAPDSAMVVLPAPESHTAAPGPHAAGPEGPVKAKPYGWILSPAIDLTFACGGLLWVLYAAYLLGAKPSLTAGVAAAAMWWLAKVGLIVFSYGHQPATLWRVYMSEPTRKSLGKLVSAWGVVALGALTCAMFVPGFVLPFVKIVLFWQVQHVLAQTYGIALIYCYKRGYFMNNFEKQTFYWMINSSILFFIIRMLTFPAAGSKEMYGLIIPFWGPLPMWVFTVSQTAVIAISLLFVFNVIAKYIRDKQMIPFPALFSTFTGLATYYLNFAFFEAAFALFTIAYYHGCQYLCVTASYYLKERGLPEGMPASQISSLLLKGPALRYFLVLAVGGVLLSDTLPRCLSMFGIAQAVTYLAVFATANFHHYFADAFIWKLRDPQVRKLLVA